MTVGSAIRTTLARRAPRLEEAAVRANWRRRNRGRSFSARELPDPAFRELAERLRRDGVLIADVDSVFGDRTLFEAAAEQADELYQAPRRRRESEPGTKATYLTKLATRVYDAEHPFARLALHSNVLAVVNAYLGLRSTLRALDLWLTEPRPGPAIQTQLWHRDADDVMNVKMFMYFTDVTRGAGPLTYALGTHPLGRRRLQPERDEQARSTDEQLRKVVAAKDWVLCEGAPGTVVFADTCGYHKQLKPETLDRVVLMAHYVSATPYVPRELELRGVGDTALTDDQYVAVFDALRA